MRVKATPYNIFNDNYCENYYKLRTEICSHLQKGRRAFPLKKALIKWVPTINHYFPVRRCSNSLFSGSPLFSHVMADKEVLLEGQDLEDEIKNASNKRWCALMRLAKFSVKMKILKRNDIKDEL